MKEVRWTETAKQTLIETSNFIRDLWNVQTEENFLDQLEYRNSTTFQQTVRIFIMTNPTQKLS